MIDPCPDVDEGWWDWMFAEADRREAEEESRCGVEYEQEEGVMEGRRVRVNVVVTGDPTLKAEIQPMLDAAVKKAMASVGCAPPKPERHLRVVASGERQ